MIAVASMAKHVVLDTSVFINFAEGGGLFQLASYIGRRAVIALDVDLELQRNLARFPALKGLGMLRWPPGDAIALAPDQLADAEALRRLYSGPGAHEDANRGEIATVLLASRMSETVVIMDDGLGKRLCSVRDLPRLSSAQLAAEMVAAGALDDETGLRVFEVATPDGVGATQFRLAVARARVAIGNGGSSAPG